MWFKEVVGEIMLLANLTAPKWELIFYVMQKQFRKHKVLYYIEKCFEIPDHEMLLCYFKCDNLKYG